jgi:hypothetical protein
MINVEVESPLRGEAAEILPMTASQANDRASVAAAMGR